MNGDCKSAGARSTDSQRKTHLRVKAEERTSEEGLKSLKIGAEDMLVTPLQLDEEEESVTISLR